VDTHRRCTIEDVTKLPEAHFGESLEPRVAVDPEEVQNDATSA
jgi:hypothetical protein